jgi:dCTP deaminase
MILSNAEICKAIELGRVSISNYPKPLEPSDPDTPFDAHSLDVHLAKYLSEPNEGPYSFDLHRPGGGGQKISSFLAANSTRHEIGPSGFSLKPKQFILGQTIEKLSLPIQVPANRILGRCLAARFEGKSSRARTGLLVHFTAPTIHPDFEGTITLEIINLGPVDFILREGMPIGQLIFEEVNGLPIMAKESQFKGQTRPEGK